MLDETELAAALRSSPEIADMLLDLWEASESYERAGYSFPRQYANWARYRASQAAVSKMQRALARVPRCNPNDYDILFNTENGTWDVVKWMRSPKLLGDVPGLGPIIGIVRDPFCVYHIPATRSPMSLGERDWEIMRRNSLTLRDPHALTQELIDRSLSKKRDRDRIQADEDHDFASYYRTQFKRAAEELGI